MCPITAMDGVGGGGDDAGMSKVKGGPITPGKCN